MLKGGILNPGINALLSRVRHTNRLVIADRGFPFWPGVETIDLALVDGVPTVLQVLRAIVPNFSFGPVWMAEEFRARNPGEVALFERALGGGEITYEAHAALKLRVPGAIGLIRTGDTTPFANVILESA